MVRPTLSELRTLPDKATLYQWNFIVVKAPPAVPFPSSNEINLRVLTSGVPKKTNQKIEYRIRGHRLFQPGVNESSGEITVTLVDTVDALVQKWIRDWREACAEYNTQTHKKTSDVEAEIVLERLDRQDKVIWRYHLVGCFLSDYDPVGGDLGSDSDIAKPTLTITYVDYYDE